MKILIDDGMQIHVGTGIGKYSKYLYDNLRKRSLCEKVEVSTFIPKNNSKKSARIAYIKHINSKKYRDMSAQYDIVHFTNYLMPFRKNKRSKYVVTVHDLVSFIYPESLPVLYRFYSRFIIRYAMCHADMILTVSHSVKNEITSKWPQYASKVNVAYPGLYDEYEGKNIADSYLMDVLNNLNGNDFFLFVGTIEKRKNLGIVIDAFIQLKKVCPNEYKLVLAGRPGYGFDAYEEKIKQSGYSKDIICTGYIDSGDVQKLYQNAAAYIFPTIYEGFGSTQLECMANHLPLILSDIPTNREVSGDYGMFFSLSDLATLVQQMEKIVSGEYDYPAHRALAEEYLKKFSWDEIAFQVHHFYESILKVN